MPTITVTDEFYQLLQQRAQATDCTPDDVLEFILWQEFAARQNRNISTPPLTKPTSKYALEHDIYQRNVEVFSRALPDLLETHKGEYVAIRHEQIVGFGHDPTALWQEIRNTYGTGGGLLVTQVSTMANFVLTSPYFRRW